MGLYIALPTIMDRNHRENGVTTTNFVQQVNINLIKYCFIFKSGCSIYNELKQISKQTKTKNSPVLIKNGAKSISHSGKFIFVSTALAAELLKHT